MSNLLWGSAICHPIAKSDYAHWILLESLNIGNLTILYKSRNMQSLILSGYPLCRRLHQRNSEKYWLTLILKRKLTSMWNQVILIGSFFLSLTLKIKSVSLFHSVVLHFDMTNNLRKRHHCTQKNKSSLFFKLGIHVFSYSDFYSGQSNYPHK
jgi:hypothetical protein